MDTINNVWYWGLGLIFLFPIITLLLNEVGYKMGRKDPTLLKPITTFKNFVLPMTALVVLLIYVLGVDRNALSIKVLETIIWVLIINAGLAFVNRFFFKSANKDSWRGNVPQLFLDIFRVFLVLFGGAIVLSQVWDVELGGLVTALGLGSFVLGLALQDTLGNLFSGIALVYEKPFAVGDWIKVEEDYGEVIEMNWRAVRIRTREGQLIVIPHLAIGQGVIINFSKPSPVHVIKLNVGFSYQDPPNKVKEALKETCLNTPDILHDPDPEIKVNEYGDSAIIYEIEFAIADFRYHEEITDDFMTRIWYTTKRYQLTIPFPQMTLHRAEQKTSAAELHDKDLVQTVEQLPKFLPIEKENTKKLLDGSLILYYGKKELIFQQGDPTGHLFIILEGDVELSVKGLDGKKVLVNILHKGDFFGEVALLSGRTSSMTATASTDIRVLKIMSQEVMDMVSRNPRLAFQLDEVMDVRRKRLQQQLE